MKALENILRVAVCVALPASCVHASPALAHYRTGTSDHKFVDQLDYVSYFAVQANKTSEQKLPHKVFEGDVVCSSTVASFVATAGLRLAAPRLLSPEILLTLTTSSYL
ncbi:MAG: hypothetical protein HYY49_11055 [Ignavibacteriales bacterium]|nr:hypothetical protein [Ignavibacteriales bacterium]